MSNKYYDLTYLSLQVNTIIVLTLFIVAMNIILVLVDSLNKSALKTYNPETICETPNLEEFAKKSLIFENHYISSLPCMPARREIFAGRKEFMWRPWGPLEIFDPRMPRIIQSAGYNTGIVTDHYHYWEETSNGYIQGFYNENGEDLINPMKIDEKTSCNTVTRNRGYTRRLVSNFANMNDSMWSI